MIIFIVNLLDLTSSCRRTFFPICDELMTRKFRSEQTTKRGERANKQNLGNEKNIC